MKKILLLIIISHSITCFAKESKKIITLKAHINKIMLDSKNSYKLSLNEFAAVYHAQEANLPCLQKALKENSLVTLTVEAYTLMVQKCEAN